MKLFPLSLVIFLFLSSCEATPPNAEIQHPDAAPFSIEVLGLHQVRIFGRIVSNEELVKIVQDTLEKLPVIPKYVPMTVPPEYEKRRISSSGGFERNAQTATYIAIENIKTIRSKPVIEAMRAAIEKMINKRVQFEYQTIHLLGDRYAFASVFPDTVIDFSNTPLSIVDKDFQGGDIYGLLKLENNTWNIVTITNWNNETGCWWKKYNVPQSLWNSIGVAQDCK